MKEQNRFVNILKKAEEGKYAVGAVNIFNYITAKAAIEAAEEIGQDVIIQTSVGTVEYFGAEALISMIDSIRRYAKVNVAVHLDHCRDKELGKRCAEAGWDSIMMDFSQQLLESNISSSREMAEIAHARGVAIEGEVGIISGTEEEIVNDREVGAGYEETIKYIKESEVDAVAPAIGTAHGVYKGTPNINFELVGQLGKENVPIVIHGGSGLSAETFCRLIKLGGRKINISSIVKNTYLEKTAQLVMSREKFSPIAFDEQVKIAVKEEIRKHLEVFSGIKNHF